MNDATAHTRISLGFAVALSTAVLAGCTFQATNTLPSYSAPDDPIERLSLWIPEDLQVRNVDFAASIYTDAADGSETDQADIGGRAFIKVHAVHKKTGEEYLLIYENIDQRPRPIQIIRFEPHPAGDFAE
jgi:hypothetical protein